MHADLLRLMRLMQDSRMGFYIHRGREGDIRFEDLVSGALYRAIVPAGYKGRKNENWYIIRLLPPPFPEGQEHVVFTTPYVVVHPDFDEWLAYFRRTLPATGGFADYEGHMKYGHGLQVRRGQERFVDIEFHHRELFAYACEAYSRAVLHGDRKSRIAFVEKMPDAALSFPRTEIKEVAALVLSATRARNGWRLIREATVIRQPRRRRQTLGVN